MHDPKLLTSSSIFAIPSFLHPSLNHSSERAQSESLRSTITQHDQYHLVSEITMSFAQWWRQRLRFIVVATSLSSMFFTPPKCCKINLGFAKQRVKFLSRNACIAQQHVCMLSTSPSHNQDRLIQNLNSHFGVAKTEKLNVSDTALARLSVDEVYNSHACGIYLLRHNMHYTRTSPLLILICK